MNPIRAGLIALGLVAAGLVAVLLWRQHTSAPGTESSAAPPVPSAALRPAGAGNLQAKSSQTSVSLSAQDLEFAAKLRARFAPVIGSRHAQIKLIEQLMAYLMEHYPDRWQTLMQGFLQELFPELADTLFAAFEKLQGYNQWLRERRDELLKLSPAERRQALWAARHAAFGDAAEEIWAAERRSEKIAATLAQLQDSAGLNNDERLARYLQAVGEAYGERTPELLRRRQTELMNGFLEVGAVQQDLRVLPRAQQHAALERIRSGLGMDAEALQRWRTLDQDRDQAWDAGQAYLLERANLAARYQGAELAQQLAPLQQRVFGAEADIIASEEAAGFFRYQQPRRIGRE